MVRSLAWPGSSSLRAGLRRRACLVLLAIQSPNSTSNTCVSTRATSTPWTSAPLPGWRAKRLSSVFFCLSMVAVHVRGQVAFASVTPRACRLGTPSLSFVAQGCSCDCSMRRPPPWMALPFWAEVFFLDIYEPGDEWTQRLLFAGHAASSFGSGRQQAWFPVA